ncbi:MAG: hypothetical protein QM499_10065 [Flavobacteriaceae bacterium]
MKTVQVTKQILILFFSVLIISCDSDTVVSEEENNPQNILEEERDVTIETLSNGEEKTWKIENAILTNESGSFDISENFNVIDDEFIFKANGSFIWRPGNDINSEGTTTEETLIDYYRSPVNSSYLFNEDSSIDLSTMDGRFLFTLKEDGTITGTLSLVGKIREGGELNLILNNKTSEDYPNIPESTLNFIEVFTFESNGIFNRAPGMIGSYSDNSLFIVTEKMA